MSKPNKYANLTQEEFDIEAERIFGELNRLEGNFESTFGIKFEDVNDLDEQIDEMFADVFGANTKPTWVEQLKRTMPSISETNKNCCTRAKKIFLDTVDEHHGAIKRGLGRSYLEGLFPKLLGSRKEKKYDDAIVQLKGHINSFSISPRGCEEFGEFLFGTSDGNNENPSTIALKEWAKCEDEYEDTWKDKLSRFKNDTFINTGEVLRE